MHIVSGFSRFFTVIGLVLLFAAWLWWLYLYRSSAAFECLYLPWARCEPAAGLSPTLALPPYEAYVLWAGGAAALLGTILRLASRGA